MQTFYTLFAGKGGRFARSLVKRYNKHTISTILTSFTAFDSIIRETWDIFVIPLFRQKLLALIQNIVRVRMPCDGLGQPQRASFYLSVAQSCHLRLSLAPRIEENMYKGQSGMWSWLFHRLAGLG